MRAEPSTTCRPGSLPAPRNAWYVVAFSDEVTSVPLARRILGDRMVLYRTEGGEPVALADYCAHRALALSAGKVVKGNRIQCAYHGIEYDSKGNCAHVPSQERIPRAMKVRSYPVAERWRWIWAWMGDPAAADESLIPDHAEFGLSEQDQDFQKIQRFRMSIKGNFQLLHENLLDVSHISFLHAGLFDSGAVAAATPHTETQGAKIRITRRVEETMEGGFAQQFNLPSGTRVSRELISTTVVPNLNIITNVLSFPDRPDQPVAVRHSPFPITPETATSCHYFAASSSNYGPILQGEELQKAIQSTWDIFLADKLVLESIQQSYDELRLEAPDVSIRADEAALHFRRILAQQVGIEQGGVSK